MSAQPATTPEARDPIGEKRNPNQWTPLALRGSRLRRWWRGIALGLALLLLVGAGAYLAWASRPLPREGTVAQIDAGALQVERAEGTWEPLQVGDTVLQGHRLRSDQGTIALIQFFDGSQMRVESAGEWEIEQLEGSPGGRASRTTIRQRAGQASLVSAPLQRGTNSRLRLELPGGSVQLVGAATFATDAQGTTTCTLLQGQGHVQAGKTRVTLSPGEVSSLLANGELSPPQDE
ncbi:MAG: hypothetical protein GX552_09775 [Chloroflexi bacterium]|jgi:hypothetical protein|nr:hypothetical protein [Chloroflexota bacterium]